jgi:hypothetical protein
VSSRRIVRCVLFDGTLRAHQQGGEGEVAAKGDSKAGFQTAEFALVAEEVMAAIRELHERGELDDVCCRRPDEEVFAEEHSACQSAGFPRG